MDLLDQIEQDNDKQLTAEHERLSTEHAQREEVNRIRHDIVTVRIKEFAEQLGAESIELNAKSGTRYFMVGGIVLVVRLHGNVDKKKLTTTKRGDVLWQYRISLVGVNMIDQVREAMLGTLSLIEYSDIRKTVNKYGDLMFGYKVVVSLLYPEDGTTA